MAENAVMAMLNAWFAHPGCLWLLAAIPIAASLLIYAQWRRRQLADRLASSFVARRAILVLHGRRRIVGVCLVLSVALTAIAAAGPQWGADPNAHLRTGRDVIIVLDLSRSMSAEQPSRRERAVRALRDLADRFEKLGGQRVALVGFAAMPRLFFPLTQDYDHLRHTLDQITHDDYPPLSVDAAVSGTRIGAAIKLALASTDSARAHRPVILLLSDGDDPAGDGEWRQGIDAARALRVHVHVVGIGDPSAAETIPIGKDVLTYDGEPVRTRLHEEVLREIARGTGGEYLPARTSDFPLGAVVQQLLDADELREDAPDDAALPVPQVHYGWFLLPAILLFMLTMVGSDGPAGSLSSPAGRAAGGEGKRAPRKFAAAGLALAALLGISAAHPPDGDEWLRFGNEAFERGDYPAALDFYEKAARVTADPGKISFNKAAAYYRLERYKEAIECYRRALDDDQAPVERRARAYYDLGNALQRYAPDGLDELAAAVASYRRCLAAPNIDADLRANARHNLEIAQMRWLKARASAQNAGKKEEPPPKYPKEPKNQENPDEGYAKVDPKDKFQPQQADDLPAATPSDRLRSGTLKVLPDQDQVAPLSKADTLTTLEDHIRRIAEARRRQRNPSGPAALSSKDW